ncbi:OTU-domain-containing protein [Aaosphaeria arxii CBS 175.79]|uniref:OTU-domain-containing protein n=1 Tax=Aaosphaeria arxii CBS 175.79 TaxID=1450172 RepID=A0A6A5Y3S1_9PLEO|nr:OTU-domain-containing protein [Aaosphaeria arxii CBS 175.79]KAF2020182.1 OTU-domain-containing protein [Aaosphaeria arxii CBS 175.79]
MDDPTPLEALQARHRKEQRDLVARSTQKKKSATKKTRKGVNDECERLEQELKERQAQELAELNGETTEDAPADPLEPADEVEANGLEADVEKLSLATSQPDAPAQPPSEQPAGPKKKQNRAKARLARRAAEQEALIAQAEEEAANMPDQREVEREQMKSHFGKYGLQEKEIRADGHCLYAAIADQMETSGLGLKPRIEPKIHEEQGLPVYKTVRHAAADFIEGNPDDFVPFMEEPINQYLQKIRNTGEWGGHMELLALAKTYGVRINVLHGDGRVDKIEPEGNPADAKEIWLGYYKHNFGLGEHYNSLRKTP